jgi:hypothetical protein
MGVLIPYEAGVAMNLVQKFVEHESLRVLSGYRKRFEEWLSTVDIDGNGQLDKEQILADFDKIQDGVMTAISGASDLARLAQEYRKKYGQDMPQ